MSIYDEYPLTALDQKARQVLGDKVVIKSLSASTSFSRLPRYVSEYLIAKYVKPDTWRQNLEDIQAKIKELLPDQEHRELLKDKLLAKGEVILIDFVEVRVDLKQGQRVGKIQALGDSKVRVPANIPQEHPGLLLGGLWGTVRVKYAPEEDRDQPNEIISFTPFQVGPPNVDEYRSFRKHFSKQEWIGLMLQSAGYSAGAFPDRRTQLLLLSRMVPLVERNVNMIELGPRQTGKTFLLRNLSPRVFTISGGKTTPANLFVNLQNKQTGILGTRQVVVFDEIAHTNFGDENETISTLKDYMESGHFSRGSLGFTSDAGIVFAGNLDVEGNLPHPKYVHLLEPLPKELIDTAFHDRIHGYLPGWEMPKITPSSLTTGVGFVIDYFGEVLCRLREDSFADKVRSVPLQAGVTRRDQVAVERIGSGLLKILYPDGNWTFEDLLEVVTFACELRQRVHNQLSILAPGEFKPKLIGPVHLSQHFAPDLQPRKETIDPLVDRLNTEAVVGAVTGLCVVTEGGKEVGGDILQIQVSCLNGSTGINVTGSRDTVLVDSIKAVYNYIRANFRELGISEQRLKTQQVAVHLVRIAEPKFGPSAGLAFLVGMVSALTGKPVKPGFAFTGEVALHGDVGPVGGLLHKITAAVRAGRKNVLIPQANASVVSQIPETIAQQINIIPVADVRKAVEVSLGE